MSLSFRILFLTATCLFFFPFTSCINSSEIARLSFEVAASNLENPTCITNASDGTNRLFITEQEGTVRILRNGSVIGTPFLDIGNLVSTSGEQGLLGIAFPPGDGEKSRFYVYYTDIDGDIVISRFAISSDPDAALPASEEIIITIGHPDQYTNHNGGAIAFGSDGFLYAGTGDGGGGGDPFSNGQNPASLLGKLIRFDVESGPGPYPPEIAAIGLRNPWRFAFDPVDGGLYTADVGQNLYEEINYASASDLSGKNYGWNIMEGFHCYGAPDCDTTGLVLPAAEYGRAEGCSVTGGFVYRGQEAPALDGSFIYGDFCSGRIWALSGAGTNPVSTLLANTAFGISAFGKDEAGNGYLAEYGSGTIYRMDIR